MAQKTEKEETEFKVPETLTLCVNNCGVTGNPATNNMCQKCFNATTASTTTTAVIATPPAPPPQITTASTSTSTSTSTATTTSKGAVKSTRSSPLRAHVKDRPPQQESTPDQGTSPGSDVSAADRRGVNRCSGCRRKVGLTGFRCRCGELFCWEHRYSDRHDCSYDYKTTGREAIARENPVVKAAKIVKV